MRNVVCALSLLSCLSLHAQVIEKNPATPRQWALQAQVAINQKNYALAMTDYRNAMAGGLINFSVMYDLACLYSLQSQPIDALNSLEKSAALGYRSVSELTGDSDLKSLHNDPRWPAIVAAVEKNAQQYHATHNDPDAFKVFTSDIDLFWKVYDQLPAEKDPAAFLDSHYLDVGTVGLFGFIPHRIESGEKLNNAIKRYPRFYNAIRPNTAQVALLEPKLHESMRKFKALYKNAEFPDVYFVIGRLGSGGTASSDGLLLGTEMFSLTPDVPVDELDDWQKSVIKSNYYLPNIVAHELMHFQQNYTATDMAGQIIKEGSADFLAQLISEGNFNQNVYAYGYTHETELKKLFVQDLAKNDYKNWLYHDSHTADHPADLGYFMGFRITQAYYQKAQDKTQAIVDILNIKDAKQFVADSGYFDDLTKK